jgi:hypothetical protein
VEKNNGKKERLKKSKILAIKNHRKEGDIKFTWA